MKVTHTFNTQSVLSHLSSLCSPFPKGEVLINVRKVRLAVSLLCGASRLYLLLERGKQGIHSESCILVAADAQSIHNITTMLQVLITHFFAVYQPVQL